MICSHMSCAHADRMFDHLISIHCRCSVAVGTGLLASGIEQCAHLLSPYMYHAHSKRSLVDWSVTAYLLAVDVTVARPGSYISAGNATTPITAAKCPSGTFKEVRLSTVCGCQSIVIASQVDAHSVVIWYLCTLCTSAGIVLSQKRLGSLSSILQQGSHYVCFCLSPVPTLDKALASHGTTLPS